MDQSQLKYLLKKYNLRPKRENGQNFLINSEIVRELIKAGDINSNDVVLEIGSGLGAVTTELCKVAKKVIAVEVDKNFIPILQKIQLVNKNLEIINQDVFKIDFNKQIKINNGQFKIVSSLPYNITSLFFRHFLEYGPRPELISVIIQKEVAERIVEKPGKHSLLSLSVQLFGKPKIEKIVDRVNFYPSPDIDSAILTLKNIKYPEKIANLSKFFALLRIAFSAKRKKVANNIANGLKIEKKDVENMLKKINLNANSRAQELSLAKWVCIFDHLQIFVI